MLQPKFAETLAGQGYRLVGSHSAVKQCRWTKNAIKGEGQCYKHTFYGINSHQCMEGTPSLACANKCTFCWRNHANPVATEWSFAMDDPEWIVQESVRNHLELVAQVAGSPAAIPERLKEARTVRHMALSLVGEPVFYPKMGEMVYALHKRRISTFLVTNGQFPDQLEELPWVTQLYVSIDAPNEAEAKEVGRPLFKDHWERLRRSLEVLATKKPWQRTVARMTMLKGNNMEDDEALDGYAELLSLGKCDFIEVKGATFSAWSERTGLSMDNVPWHEDVVRFAERLAQKLPDYGVACEHEHSNSMLLARKDRYLQPTGKWRTWIDFDGFADAALEGTPRSKEELVVETPAWALADGWQESQAEEAGFDPVERRRYRRPKNTKRKFLEEAAQLASQQLEP
eukprot:TRINITY_DN19280_c0_g2_i5.p1 TRINITY_DN19280_c0_g2~~TRINITY_DN19280_c0_g2_i5.p1  ORF type:complete len:399 (+),score=79.81 TRINITY_DN19280_c0_g2_i5:513-1709(+)